MNKSEALSIYFASFSGTAESFALSLQQECEEKGLASTVQNISDFTPDSLALQDNFVFIVATHYEGNHPDSADRFVEWMNDKGGNHSIFKGKKATLFGLGDKSYDQFNQFGKDVLKFIEGKGIEIFFPPGWGNDEDAEIETDFTKWRKGFVEFVQANGARSKEPQGLQAVGDKFIVSKGVGGDLKAGAEGPSPALKFAKFLEARTAKLIRVKETLPNSTPLMSTLEATLTIPEGAGYSCGDNMAIFLPNPPGSVFRVLRHYGLSGKELVYYSAESSKLRATFNNGNTIKQVLEWGVDLHGPLKPSQLSLIESADPLFDKSGYKSKLPPYFSIVDLLESGAIRVSVSKLIEITASNNMRYFSIASSSRVSPRSIRLVVKVDSKDQGNRIWRGLASEFFSRYKGEPQPVELRYLLEKSPFKLPEDGKPCVMIAIGSGIAPFLGLIQEKRGLLSKKGDKQVELADAREIGSLWLVLGVRHPDEDLPYGNELELATKDGVIQTLDIAFSKRDKKHVQDILNGKGDDIVKLLVEEKGNLMICGSLAMAQGVLTTVEGCLRLGLKIDDVAAEDIMRQLKSEKRIVFEAWG